MNKRHLSVAVISVLALSSTTIASAEGGSHRRMGGYEHLGSVTPIGLINHAGVLTVDTSSSTPSFLFDTSTATSNVDDEPGISDDGVGDDVFSPATSAYSDHSDHSSEDSQD